MLLLEYALAALLLLTFLCLLVSFFFILRSISGFASGLGSSVHNSTDSERGARMFDGPEYAEQRRRLGRSILVFLCCFAILFSFTLIKKQLA